MEGETNSAGASEEPEIAEAQEGGGSFKLASEVEAVPEDVEDVTTPEDTGKFHITSEISAVWSHMVKGEIAEADSDINRLGLSEKLIALEAGRAAETVAVTRNWALFKKLAGHYGISDRAANYFLFSHFTSQMRRGDFEELERDVRTIRSRAGRIPIISKLIEKQEFTQERLDMVLHEAASVALRSVLMSGFTEPNQSPGQYETLPKDIIARYMTKEDAKAVVVKALPSIEQFVSFGIRFTQSLIEAARMPAPAERGNGKKQRHPGWRPPAVPHFSESFLQETREREARLLGQRYEIIEARTGLDLSDLKEVTRKAVESSRQKEKEERARTRERARPIDRADNPKPAEKVRR